MNIDKYLDKLMIPPNMNYNIRLWDYKGSGQYSDTDVDKWVWTFGSRINQVSTQIIQKTCRGGGRYLFTHSNLIPLFEELPGFYKTEDVPNQIGVLSGRYSVHVSDRLPPTTLLLASASVDVYINEDKLEIWRIDKPPQNSDGSNEIPEFIRVFKTKKDYDKEYEFYAELSKNIGYITVLNYK